MAVIPPVGFLHPLCEISLKKKKKSVPVLVLQKMNWNVLVRKCQTAIKRISSHEEDVCEECQECGLSQCMCWPSSDGTRATHTHQQSGPKDLNTQDFRLEYE